MPLFHAYMTKQTEVDGALKDNPIAYFPGGVRVCTWIEVGTELVVGGCIVLVHCYGTTTALVLTGVCHRQSVTGRARVRQTSTQRRPRDTTSSCIELVYKSFFYTCARVCVWVYVCHL